MEFKNTVEALKTNADEITRLLSVLNKPEGLSRIDIDLILDKLRFMYDLMLDIQGTVGRNEYTESKQLNTEKNDRGPSDILTIEPDEEVDVSSKVETSEKESEKIESTKEKSFVEIVDKTDEEKLKERKQAARAQIEQDLKKEKEEQLESGSKKSVISDRFKGNKPILAEELSSKKTPGDLASQLKSQTASGINPSFGINEKFEIINELFGGNKEKFEYALQVVSKAASFVEAYNFLKENYNWDMDNIHVQRLLEQIRRKLIVQRKDE